MVGTAGRGFESLHVFFKFVIFTENNKILCRDSENNLVEMFNYPDCLYLSCNDVIFYLGSFAKRWNKR